MTKTLYKNVDIQDLDSILKHGILSANESGNHNWESGKRAPNSSDVVYLFDPKTELNAFPQYGLALLVVKVSDAHQVEFAEHDYHEHLYDEYTVPRVAPEQIIAIKVPRIAKSKARFYWSECGSEKLEVSQETLDRIEWVEIDFECYRNFSPYPNAKNVLIRAGTEDQAQVEKTLTAVNTSDFSFFTGYEDDGTRIELLNVIYK